MTMTMTVTDGDREIRFEGELLAESSSFRPTKDRWAEFQLYRTVGGQYVLVGIGRSNKSGEIDHHWAQVSKQPYAVIERLTLMDEYDARVLPQVARRLLQLAGEKDEGIRDAFAVDVIQ